MRLTIDKPNIKGDDIESLRKQTNNYLSKFSEVVDLMLGNIDDDNMSTSLTGTLKSLDAQVKVIADSSVTSESRLNSLQRSSAVEKGDKYLKIGTHTAVCFGTANSSPVAFPLTFASTPTVIFSANPYTSVLQNANATEFSLTNNPTRIDYIAIGSI